MDNKIEAPKPGIYYGVPFDEYLSWNAFHKSMVMPALRSTAHLKHHIETERKPSKIMNFGSLVDCMLLEPDIFGDQFVKQPEEYPDTKTGDPKPWNNNAKFCRQWNEDHAHKTVYSDADYKKAAGVIQGIQDHTTATAWVNDAKYQVAIVWEDSETGIPCKGRIDILHQDRIVDLKVTFNASPSEFKRTINAQGYHIQAAMYTLGFARTGSGELLPFNLIAAEDQAPHCVAAYTIGPESILTGEHLFQKAIRRYKDYLESGAAGYSQFPEEIEIPNWAINEIDESLLGDTQ